jgi:dihydropteroate synthase
VKDTYLVENYSINCKGNLIDLSTPKIMSIVNTTPDSFYDGGQYNTIEKALQKVEVDISNNATFIDIGGYSSKPNAAHVTEEEELKRTIPVIEAILKSFPEAVISIDTFRGKVAKEAVDAGAALINDISAFELDKEMINTLKTYKVPYILMHMLGTPQNMQKNPSYKNVVKEIVLFLSNKIRELKTFGIHDIIIDPGFGFGKTLSNNYELIANLNYFKILKHPLLVGVSRKSIIYKLLNINSLESINGTTALNMYSLLNGTNILRVHDTKEAKECIRIFNEIQKF